MMNKILKKVEPYYVATSYMFIGFFICVTGVQLLPGLAMVSGEGSLTPLCYSISVMLGFLYFAFYKTFRLTIEEDKIK